MQGATKSLAAISVPLCLYRARRPGRRIAEARHWLELEYPMPVLEAEALIADDFLAR